jgi:PhnB protein
MARLNSYLHFNGNAEEAFNFYKSIFGGEFITLMRNRDVPAEVQNPPNEAEADQIMHVSLQVGDSMLMGSDFPSAYGKAILGTNFHVSISAESREEADRLFNGLSAGGKVMMPMADAFWGSYFGMFNDKFSVQWMVSFSTMDQ